MELSMNEKAVLASYTHTDGFKLFCQIMKDEVLKFNSALLVATKDDDVINAHKLASAAAKFYEGILNRVDSEVTEYTQTPRADDPPQDLMAGLLDIENKEE